MSYAELKAFDAVARNGSFADAAKELRRTQPTLTMQIAQLEKSFNVELIIRRRGKVDGLTPLGQKLLDTTRPLFALERDSYNLLRDAGDLLSGEVRIIATSPVIVIRLVQAFNERFPKVTCHMKFGNSEEVLDSIVNCDSELGILGGSVDHPECISKPVAKPEIVLVGHKDHLANKPDFLTREEFANEVLLLREPGSETRELLLEKMNQHSYEPLRIVEIGRRSGAIAAAMAGMGLAAISEHELEPNPYLRIIRLKSFHIFGTNHAICLKSRARTRLLQLLFESCEQLCV